MVGLAHGMDVRRGCLDHTVPRSEIELPHRVQILEHLSAASLAKPFSSDNSRIFHLEALLFSEASATSCCRTRVLLQLFGGHNPIRSKFIGR